MIQICIPLFEKFTLDLSLFVPTHRQIHQQIDQLYKIEEMCNI